MEIIAKPLGYIMKALYYLVKNYGMALLLFTFVTRLILFPMSIKQQKSTAKMGMLAPELEKLKKKYGKNQKKLQEEQMALYAKAGVNPMASCLPMLVTMVILFALIPIIYGPLTYISKANKNDIIKSNNLISGIYTVSSELNNKESGNTDKINEMINKLSVSDDEKKQLKEKGYNIEKLYEVCKIESDNDIKAAGEKFKDYISKEENCKNISKIISNNDTLKNDIIEAVKRHPDIDGFMLNEDYISKNLASSRPELMTFSFVNNADGKYADILPTSVQKAAMEIDYKSFGMDMGVIPSFKDLTWVIPVTSFVLQLIVTIVSQRFQKKNNPAAANSMGMGMKITFMILPIFSLWIGFSYPAGLGLYWCYSSLFALIQTIVLNIAYSPAKIAIMVEKEREKRKNSGKKTLIEKMAEQQLEKDGNTVVSSDDDDEQGEKKLSKSEKAAQDRRKIAEARRRMAEKYGDEYKDFLDDDNKDNKK